MAGKLQRTTKQFIKEVKLIHGNKYDYSKAVYTGTRNKVIIICPNHGMLKQTAYGHLHGQG